MLILAFINGQRVQGHAVESCRVLREQGLAIAARTYRSWKQRGRPVAARTLGDARIFDAVRDAAWTAGLQGDPRGRRRLAPRGSTGARR